ncbi:hypothetical protein BN946_scf184999.g69 [Trametes cinnabarina]|uniref:Uncharacterized protein n=1 Tax=Pycnoporus cinnabarinus TaxID=5643 RepID=A0A060SDG0_PYCCI|nr:hypothetical protein BN946_scf184999.g69 [Trametes cinnabarina]
MLLVNAAAPIALLLAVPHNPQAADTCLSNYFYGTHGTQDVFITTDELCIADVAASSLLSEGALVPLEHGVELREMGANLTLMVQADMLAYHVPGEPAQLGLPDRIGTPEVTQLVANVSAIYSPELTVGFTPACCSDHQSFHTQGFPATQVFERAGPIADPMYHNSGGSFFPVFAVARRRPFLRGIDVCDPGDLSERDDYDFDQLKSIAKVQFATLLHVAGFDLEDDNE